MLLYLLILGRSFVLLTGSALLALRWALLTGMTLGMLAGMIFTCELARASLTRIHESNGLLNYESGTH